MKLITFLALAATAQAHCKSTPPCATVDSVPNEETNTATDRFSKLVINGEQEAAEWISVRKTKNYQSNGGVTSVDSPDMRCYQASPGTGTATIAAGEVLGFAANAAVTHFGPVQFYMAKVPDSADINTWEPAGNVWFKIGSITAVPPLGSSEATWPAYS